MQKAKLVYNIILVGIAVLLIFLSSGCEQLGNNKLEKTGTSSAVSSEREKQKQPVSYTAKNYDEVKAVWISYIELKTILYGKDEKDFTESIRGVYQNIAELGLNTVIVHVRPYGDAVYPSLYFPWSAYVKAYGEAPEYDPLAIMIKEAHQKDLAFHAWINPYRAQTEEEAQKTKNDYPFSKWYHGSQKNQYVVNLSGRWYYNPGIEEVRQLIIGGVRELVQYYEVDGIHFDDYFYPTTDASFDAKVYQKYREEGGTLELDAWRRENVNALLRDTYIAIKKINDTVVFGVSPQANITNNYNSQYADVIQWCSTAGYLDYICPQIYYSFKSETTDFEDALSQWVEITTQPDVQLYVGVAPYKIGKEDRWACTAANGGQCSAVKDCGENGWRRSDVSQSDILKQQVKQLREEKRCSGVCFYSYNSLFAPSSDVAEQVQAEREHLKKILTAEK